MKTNFIQTSDSIYCYATITRTEHSDILRKLLLFSQYNYYNHWGEFNAVYENSLAEILPDRIIITVFPEIGKDYTIYSFSVGA